MLVWQGNVIMKYLNYIKKKGEIQLFLQILREQISPFTELACSEGQIIFANDFTVCVCLLH